MGVVERPRRRRCRSAHAYLRVVPTADLNTTFGAVAGGVPADQLFGISHKGVGGFTKEIFTAPFHAHGTVGKIALAPANVLLRLIEEARAPDVAEPATVRQHVCRRADLHPDRADDAGSSLVAASAPARWAAAVVVGFLWTAFHILIILLQAFIFMMLTIVYLSMSAESH